MNSVKVSSWITFAWIKLDLKVLCFLLIQVNTLGHQNLKRIFLDYNTLCCKSMHNVSCMEYVYMCVCSYMCVCACVHCRYSSTHMYILCILCVYV